MEEVHQVESLAHLCLEIIRSEPFKETSGGVAIASQ